MIPSTKARVRNTIPPQLWIETEHSLIIIPTNDDDDNNDGTGDAGYAAIYDDAKESIVFTINPHTKQIIV